MPPSSRRDPEAMRSSKQRTTPSITLKRHRLRKTFISTQRKADGSMMNADELLVHKKS
jgi:hypothetical protein